ncbi:hypothetical protein Glove_227g131 [Diversispora epigaea]|uniref:Uncharacterized protein n=1 Tax=Diversispora epigaea TaxID=1348612 RepID=A0A397IGY0_9GLOM|nr:hypothetical protein Glove_227g131 [Diversispora epigaea]
MSKVLEEEVEELIESIRSSIDWVVLPEWIAKGEPYEEHEEVLMQQKCENGIAYSGHDVPKEYYLYILVLPNNEKLLLQTHLHQFY